METTMCSGFVDSILHLSLRIPAVFLSSLIFTAVHAYTHIPAATCFHIHEHVHLPLPSKPHTEVELQSHPEGCVTVWHWPTSWYEDIIPKAPVAQSWKSAPVSLRYKGEGIVLLSKAKSWALKVLLECLLLKISHGLALGCKSSEGKDHVFISHVCST